MAKTATLREKKSEELRIIHDYSQPRKISGFEIPRVQMDFSDCTSLTEQHSLHTNDINHLVKRYTPSELDLYLMARDKMRTPITGHDFSREPDLQTARNEVYRLTEAYKELPDKYKKEFKDVVDFIKFADDPKNFQKLVDFGLIEMKPKEGAPATVPESKKAAKSENSAESTDKK